VNLKALNIRAKLLVAFGGLIVLGVLNIFVYYWGANQRNTVFRELERAIERQTLITEATNLLEDQKRFVDLMTGVIGVSDAAPPSDLERERFAQAVDTIPALLYQMVSIASPDDRPAVIGLFEKTGDLAASWKRFYDLQWRDPAQAIAELYTTAEPLSSELLTVDFPAAVDRERAHLAEARAAFTETDRAFGTIAWFSFVVSALAGGLLAFVIARGILRAIYELKAGAEKIGSGRLEHRIPVESSDELGEVATSFNQMAERLRQRTDELAAKQQEVELQRDNLVRAFEELQATQAQLVQQEKLASLGALTAGIAHEIKNPLNFVNNFASVSKELAEEVEQKLASGASVDELRDILGDLKLNAQMIEQYGQRADAIVRSMLLHSRSEPGQRESSDLNLLLDEYTELAYHGMRAQHADFTASLEKDFDPVVGSVELVQQDMGRVFLNLLNNALYALHDKYEAQRANGYEPKLRVSTLDRGRQVEIRIRDNGNGIPPEIRQKIFEPFFTTKPAGDGTGLGLSLSHDIVAGTHGGRLEVETEEGSFTEFVITLPK